MSEKKPSDDTTPPRYEAPRIVWRERYQPQTFGLSCAKLPGQGQQCSSLVSF